MTLTEALSAVFDDGSRITRAAWASPQIFVSTEDRLLCIKGVDPDGLYHPWTISEADFYADDWRVME